MNIIDLHTHVLPGMDDGARDMDTALQMLKNAAASDVKALAVTPHCNIPGRYDNYCDANYMNRLRALRSAAEEAGIDVRIMAGSEARANDLLLPMLEKGKLMTLNGSRYLLTEFAPDVSPQYCEKMLKGILAMGYVPLIAHPERYECLWQRTYLAERWLNMGCHIQLTAASILGKFGAEPQRSCTALMREDLVACVASDAHGQRRRTNYLGDVAAYLSCQYSPQYAQMLLWHNPLRMSQNQEL